MSTLTRLPGPHTLQNLPSICLRILELTTEDALRELWRRERNGARAVLRRTRREGYARSTAAEWDLDWAVDTLSDLEEGLRADDRRRQAASEEEAEALFAAEGGVR